MENDLRTVVPNIPIWAVYYNDNEDTISISPVLWFENRVQIDGEGAEFDLFEPVDFSPDGMMEISSLADNFIGLSLSPEPLKEDYQAEIDRYRQRNGLEP